MKDNRLHERIDRELYLTVILDGQELGGRAANISIGGMFVHMHPLPPMGKEIKLKVRFPALNNESILKAVVRWHGDGGVGLQFGSVRAIDVWAINQLILHSS